MKLYAPKYYTEFKCIADKCKHSCCIGWEIDIDDLTLDIYNDLQHEYGDSILKSISYEGEAHFRLCKDERCPHLDERGLCKIIKNVGEEYLCCICREHPRFYNNTAMGKEVGVGLACEEAARIILSSDSFGDFVEVGFTESEAEKNDFDSLPYRDDIFCILADRKMSYSHKKEYIFKQYGISLSNVSDEKWKEIISSLEYLDDNHKNLFLRYSSKTFHDEKNEDQLLRALAYFIYRHCSEAYSKEDFRRSLGFSLLCERLFASVLYQEKISNISDVVEVARVISEELEYSEENTDAIKTMF